jgi:hypothetical protein
MKPALLFLPLAISLSACAQAVMTADACKSGAADHLGGSAALLGSSVRSDLLSLARDDYGLNKLAANDAGPCARLQNKNPRSYDLHKLGDGPAPPVLLGDAKCPRTRA